MRVAIFGGAFDPIHCEHFKLVEAAIQQLKLDKVIVMPSFLSPHKQNGNTSARDRFEMCRLAFRRVPQVTVSDYELCRSDTSYSYLTCKWFSQQYPQAQRFFLVGADMLGNFPQWYQPQEILKYVDLAACGRGAELSKDDHRKFIEKFGCDFCEVHFTGDNISSTELRVALAFPDSDLSAIDENVLAYIRERELYQYPVQARALTLEKSERRVHSYRVARMACKRARELKIKEENALLAAMLHDCGKYISLDDPLLSAFQPQNDVPQTVMHQYIGAYLAEHEFGIADEDILNAIRYHTSGRPNMSMLEKLIFLSDLLEEGRAFPGVEDLRKLFWRDIDECLIESLREQLKYLQKENIPICPLTEQAYRWISLNKS